MWNKVLRIDRSILLINLSHMQSPINYFRFKGIVFITRKTEKIETKRFYNLFDTRITQMVGAHRAEIGQVYKPVSLASVRDDIRRGGTPSCTEGHSRDSTAVR